MTNHETAFAEILSDDLDRSVAVKILNSLRPYCGEIKHDWLQEYAELILSLPRSSNIPPKIKSDLVVEIWNLCYEIRLTALAPGSALKRNGLISDDDAAGLESWVDVFESCGIRWANNFSWSSVFSVYRMNYLAGEIRIPNPQSCSDLIVDLLTNEIDKSDKYEVDGIRDSLKCIEGLHCYDTAAEAVVLECTESKFEEVRDVATALYAKMIKSKSSE